MKVILSGADLSEAVGRVIKAVGVNKNAMPILEGIKLSAEEDRLVLTATDLELAIETSIRAKVAIEGATVVPGKFFLDFVRKLTDTQVELSVADNNQMSIKYGDSVSKINCYSAHDFPEIRKIENAETFTIIKHEFRDLVNKVAFCASSDDTRAILKGVSLEIDDYTLTGVALDGYRLAKAVKQIERTTAKMSAVIPARSIYEIVKLIEDNLDPVVIGIQKNYLVVDLDHTKITTRLLDGDFINYRQIIPTQFNSSVTVSRAQLEDALERTSLVSRVDKNNLVKFEIKDHDMVISANSELGSAVERVIIKLSGIDLVIAFNARYLIELMRYMGSESVVLKFINASGPAIIQPVGAEDDYLYLVLPVRLLG